VDVHLAHLRKILAGSQVSIETVTGVGCKLMAGLMPEKPKKPFEIDLAVERLRAAVGPLPKAAMFELAEEGFTSLFELIVACVISIRTQK